MTPHFSHPLAMGLQPLDIGAWLAPLDGDAALLAARSRLLDRTPDAVLAAAPDAMAAVAELCDELMQRGRIVPRAVTDARAALDAVGRQIAEDVCVLLPAAESYRLAAAVVCFPNRWRLRDKLGKSLADIHAPVPEFAARLARPVDQFLRRLAPLAPQTRRNWGVADTAELHLPDPGAPIDPARSPPPFLREEHQSFVKLPVSGAVVFSIRTIVRPWTNLSDAEQQSLRAVLAALPNDWRRYKGLVPRS